MSVNNDVMSIIEKSIVDMADDIIYERRNEIKSFKRFKCFNINCNHKSNNNNNKTDNDIILKKEDLILRIADKIRTDMNHKKNLKNIIKDNNVFSFILMNGVENINTNFSNKEFFKFYGVDKILVVNCLIMFDLFI